MASLAAGLDCKIGSMPFTYFGLPLGTTRPSVKDCWPLVTQVERRLSNTAALSYGRRLTIVILILSSSHLLHVFS